MTNNAVYVSLQTGRIHIIHEDMVEDKEMPQDLETSDEFVPLPDKRDFDLGNELVYRFTKMAMPQEYENIRAIFHHKGAYGRFKRWLDSNNLLQRWIRFQEEQTEAALREWCLQNGLEVTK